MKQYTIKTSNDETFKFSGALIAKTGKQVSMTFNDLGNIADTNKFHSASLFKTVDGSVQNSVSFR